MQNLSENINNKEYELNKEKQHKRRIKLLLMRVSLMSMLLIVSTYAWFTSQKDITLSNIRGVVEVVENMEISLDAKTWYQRIDLSDAINAFANAQISRDAALGETDNNTKSTALAVVPSQLLPVSGMGELNDTTMPLYNGEATSTSLSAIAKCAEETVDLSGKDIAADNGYFAFDIYIKNTSRDNEADVLQLNINSSAQVLTETIKKNIIDDLGNEVERTYNGNEASGLQNTIRVALAKYEGEVSSTATQFDILDSTKSANISDIAIWEPNAYDHVETIVANNNRLINGTESNKLPFTNNQAVDTYALKETAVTATKIDNVYNIASTGLGKQNTFKTDNIKDTTTNEVQSYRIKTTNEKPIDIQNISNENFEISANTVTRYRVYVWLEGQDVDCINVASLGGGIELDLGLTKDDEVGNVLSEIDPRVTYSTTELTEEPVIATITMEEEIEELPEGWTYTDATKVAIKKTYTINTTEQVEIKNTEGKITRVEVTINNIDTLAKKVIGNENTMYGKYVNYPIDIDGVADDNDWRIFYASGNDVFIISDDYAPHTKIENDKLAEAKIYTDGLYSIYSICWSGLNNLSEATYTISDSKYMISRAGEFAPATNPNYHAVGSLLETSIWTCFVDNKYANDAIGSPTIEMWSASWNTIYDSTNYQNEQIYCNNGTEDGYYVGSSDLPTSYELDMSSYTGYGNSLYYPHTSIYEGCNGYWLSSPSARSLSFLLKVAYSGNVKTELYTSGGDCEVAFRPVVCLNPGIKATQNGEIWELATN